MILAGCAGSCRDGAIAMLVGALGETFILFVHLVGPPLHHVAELDGGVGEVSSELAVCELRIESVMEATDCVFVGDVGDGGAYFEKTVRIGPQGLVHLLLDL